MIPRTGSFTGADIVATVYVPTLQKYMVFGGVVYNSPL